MARKPKVATSREDALRGGITRYQGEPCRHGHDGVRYALSGQCVQCALGHSKNQHLRAKQSGSRIDLARIEREARSGIGASSEDTLAMAANIRQLRKHVEQCSSSGEGGE